MKNIFCVRPFGLNVGNDIIFKGIRALFDSVAPGETNLISVPATSKYQRTAGVGFDASSVYRMNTLGSGVIIGGGNLYENNELEFDAQAFSSLDVPLMTFSVSRGRIYSSKGVLVQRTDVTPDSTLKLLIDKAVYSLSRDSATHSHLQSIGISKDIVIGCPSLALDLLAPNFNEASDEKRDTVLISIRTPSLMNIPFDLRFQIPSLVRKIKEMVDKKIQKRVYLVCQDQRDLEFAKSFRDIPMIYETDVNRYLSILKHSALNISFRLHSAIPSAVFGVPIVKLSYDERATSLIELIGLKEFEVNLCTDYDILKSVDAKIDLALRQGSRRNLFDTRRAEYIALQRHYLREFLAIC